MNRFNWEHFLKTYGIPYVTDREGVNVSRGNLGLPCPLCTKEGNPDPSEHLGINPKTGAWNCWRRASHRGRKPHKLICALLNCTYQEANHIVEHGAKPDLNDFNSLVNLGSTYFNKKTEEKPFEDQVYGVDKDLNIPNEFKSFELKNTLAHRMVNDYMVWRGFRREDLPLMTAVYHLRWARSGPWAYRVIFPVTQRHKLLTWTGRAIGNDPIRYKTLSVEETQGLTYVAILSIKDTIWNYDDLVEFPGDTLVVTEGPFDALKLDAYGRALGLRATCLWGLSITDSQIAHIKRVVQHYHRVVVMLDNPLDSNGIKEQLLPHIRQVTVQEVPGHQKDPGDLSRKQVKELASILATGVIK